MKEYTIDQYRDKMMEIAQKTLPKESKRILATESQKLKRHLLKYAKQNVPVSEFLIIPFTVNTLKVGVL